MGGWSTNGFPFGSNIRLVSGRSITHFGASREGIYGWAHRRFVDSANYLQSEMMPLGADAAPSPWACTRWGGQVEAGVCTHGIRRRWRV